MTLSTCNPPQSPQGLARQVNSLRNSRSNCVPPGVVRVETEYVAPCRMERPAATPFRPTSPPPHICMWYNSALVVRGRRRTLPATIGVGMTLRAELQSVTGRGDASGFPALRALARGVARRLHPTSEAADDLVSILLLELIAEARDLQSHLFDDLLELDDQRLRARLRRRLYQAALREKPRWKVYRALQLHVAAALSALPPTPNSPPSSLVDGESGRLSRARVASAVAWLVARGLVPLRRPSPGQRPSG